MTRIDFRQCSNANCRLRFPASEDDRRVDRCPLCGARTSVVAGRDVRHESAELAQTDARLPLVALLDNVRSVFNVGSIFRSADAAGIQRLYLCGVTPTPDHPRLAKTALGSHLSVAWSHHNNALDVADELTLAGWHLWALEEDPCAIPVSHLGPIPTALALVVGSERAGVDPDLLARCERIVAIPMRGVKRSLNVATAFGVAAVLLAERMSGGCGG